MQTQQTNTEISVQQANKFQFCACATFHLEKIRFKFPTFPLSQCWAWAGKSTDVWRVPSSTVAADDTGAPWCTYPATVPPHWSLLSSGSSWFFSTAGGSLWTENANSDENPIAPNFVQKDNVASQTNRNWSTCFSKCQEWWIWTP